jgi:ABC-type polar amino acid transport system ATPase subunit
MIKVKHLVKSLQGNRILDDVNLAIPQGEVAVLIGASGSGKSTLLRCINGLERFESGAITVDGTALTLATKESSPELLKIRQQLGMVFQQFHLFPHMTALGNVTCALIHVLKQSPAQAETQALELLDKVGLKAKRDSKPAQLSGGQQQRVAIARALAVNPKAMLFDEPTSALDPRMADEVLGVMLDLAKAGMTMGIVTHAMGFARRAAHRIYFMHAGKIIESNAPGAFFDAPQTPEAKDFLKKAE